MTRIARRLIPLLLAVALLVPATPRTATAAEFYWFTLTYGSFSWKDLDGQCVAACAQYYNCPCWPLRVPGYISYGV